MRTFRRRLFTAALIFILSAAVFLIAGGFILSAVLTQKVTAKLKAVDATIGSLRINLFTRAIRIKDFEWPATADSVSRHVIIADIKASGIQIIDLWRNRELNIHKIEINDGSVFFNGNFKKGDSTRQDTVPIRGLKIDRLALNSIHVRMVDDTTHKYSATVGLVLYQVALDSPLAWRDPSAYKIKNIESIVKDFEIDNWNDLYALKIKEGTFDKEKMKIRIDSIQLLPRLSKADFAKKVKSQLTRTTLLIGSLEAEGVNMAVHLKDTSIMATSINLNGLSIQAYKDKRYPFTRKKKFPLPMESFRAIGIGIEADTIHIHKGTITYEEFPVEGFRPAHITFDGVEATMTSVNNREFKNLSGYSTLDVSANVMESGEIKATFKMPLEEKKRYSAEGYVKNLPLKELNPILKDVAFLEISSGRLNRMNFAFTYDDNGSQGELKLDYSDLKILGLKKEKEGDVNGFKTLLINAAVKNNQALTGNIAVVRNQKKAVFNLWTLSIVDGIRSALMPGKKNKSK